MKKFALAVSIVGLSTMGAWAADLPARPYTKAPVLSTVYDWSGVYVGGNGGYGFGSKCWTLDQLGGVPVLPGVPEGCSNTKGALAGGQVGYRWQTGALVAGLEGQGDWANLKGSNLSLAFGPAVTNRSKVDAIGIVSGHFGYAFNNALFYVKSGVAIVSDKYTGVATGNGVAFDSGKETRAGFAAGLGLEYGFAPNWSSAVEYDHLFMFESDVPFNSIPGGFNSRIDGIHQDLDMVTLRVNYRFGGPIVARY